MPGAWKGWTKISCKFQREEKIHSPVPTTRGGLMLLPPSPAFPSPSPSSVDKTHTASGCSRSIANLKGVIHGNTRVVHKSASCSPQVELRRISVDSSARPSVECDLLFHQEQKQIQQGSNKQQQHQQQQQSQAKIGMRKFAGCHGCNVADEAFIFPQSRDGSRDLSCRSCGASFSRYEALEHHHALRHAVTELGRADSSRNVVEIIFRTSWVKKEAPSVRIERILKVNNTQKTIARFEEFRDLVKSRAANSSSGGGAAALRSRHARCIADGNELLRFHATNVACELGARASPSLCSSPSCGACKIIRWGFTSRGGTAGGGRGIRTAATSGRAHGAREEAAEHSCIDQDKLGLDLVLREHRLRAMLVCRVIAGRSIQRSEGDPLSGFDSIVAAEDLYVFNPKAVLPCFVVLYWS